MPTDWDRVGRAAYEAQHGGRPPVDWDVLSEADQKAWIASSVAAVREFLVFRLELRERQRHR